MNPLTRLPQNPLRVLYLYYRHLIPCLLGRKLKSLKSEGLPRPSLIYLHSLAYPFTHWSTPHYRKGTYAQDMKDNLRNVAIPGTGLPLSIFAYSRYLYVVGVLAFPPILSLVSSVYRSLKSSDSFTSIFSRSLLCNNTWFTHWRMNCNLVAMHSYKMKASETKSSGYEMENKWVFLEEGAAKGVKVSPYTSGDIVVKHRNEEGGMGIHFYRNAANGGDWIIQSVIRNSKFVQSLLPPGAPLSTFRVITMSRNLGLKDAEEKDVEALSVVFRAGRKGAETDHDSILFDVHPETGLILGGTTNKNWYQLGPGAWLTCPWRSGDPEHTVHVHPDNPSVPVAGIKVDVDKLRRVAENAHFKTCVDVPMAGWDVVLSDDVEGGVCLLEVNLSCNFFRGTFDERKWMNFLEDVTVRVEEIN